MNAAAKIMRFHDHEADNASALAALVRDACLLEIRALKPGNVGLHGDGHGMTAEHFVRSAQATAAPISAPQPALGERILQAVSATRAVVDCNTNLGIVLLVAPLMQAAWRSVALPVKIPLRVALQEVLRSTNQADAAMTYAAIRLANPGGLGAVAEHDVRDAPSINLLQAMQAAASRDAIAQEYCTDYARVFALGVSAFAAAEAQGMSEEWAATACYLAWLAQVPDTHVARKHGVDAARQLGIEAQTYRKQFITAKDPARMSASLLEWDGQLKQRNINPGTSADLTVASIVAYRLQHGFLQ